MAMNRGPFQSVYYFEVEIQCTPAAEQCILFVYYSALGSNGIIQIISA